MSIRVDARAGKHGWAGLDGIGGSWNPSGAAACGIAHLGSFPVPVLLIVGEYEDEDGDAPRVAAPIPHGESLVLPGLGHCRAFDRSDLVLPTARAFLDRWFA